MSLAGAPAPLQQAPPSEHMGAARARASPPRRAQERSPDERKPPHPDQPGHRGRPGARGTSPRRSLERSPAEPHGERWGGVGGGAHPRAGGCGEAGTARGAFMAALAGLHGAGDAGERARREAVRAQYVHDLDAQVAPAGPGRYSRMCAGCLGEGTAAEAAVESIKFRMSGSKGALRKARHFHSCGTVVKGPHTSLQGTRVSAYERSTP